MKSIRAIISTFIFLLIFTPISFLFGNANFLYIDKSEQKEFTIPEQTTTVSKYFYDRLNFSPFFQTKNLINSKKVQDDICDPFLGKGQKIIVAMEDGEKIECMFFDRKSKNLLVVGAGFANEMEKCAPFVHMFNQYDVLLFNHRGHGLSQPNISDPSQWSRIFKPLGFFINLCADKNTPKVNIKKTTFGNIEPKDLITIVNNFKSKKDYGNTYGLGLCFSTFVFCKAQVIFQESNNTNLFDKLILDSSLNSIKNTIESLNKNPELIFNPQKKKSSLGAKKQNKSLSEKVASMFFERIKVLDETTSEYLSKIDVPILFFHGKDDSLTTYEFDFMQNWKSANNQKLAVIFENSSHLLNHLKNKELYCCISNLFLDLPCSDQIAKLTKKPEKLVRYNFQKNLDDSMRLICP